MLAGISRTPPVRWLRALIARDPLFSGALGVGALLRLLAMAGYPGAMWFSGDSYVYVGAALRPRPVLSKTTGYSLFLRALLPFHSFTLVTAVQHLMGLGIAVMIYLLARRAGVSKRWAAIATLPQLLDGFIIEDEHMIMAEALFTFLVMLAMLLILWRYRMGWISALAAGLLVGYAVDVRSEGLPLLILFPAFLAYRAVRMGWTKWRGWAAVAALSVGCVAPVLAYAAWFHDWNGNYALTRSEGFYLWGRVSSFAECSVIKPPADELAICPGGAPSSRTAPGDYIWHFAPIHQIAGGPVSVANNRLLRDFAIRAVEAQPFAYAKAVTKGVVRAFLWPRTGYPDPGTVSYYYFRLQPRSIPNNHSWIPGGTAYQDAVRYGHASPSTVIQPFAAAISVYEHLVYTYGPLLFVIIVVGLGGIVRVEGLRARRPRLAWSRRNGSMLPWVTGVVLLVAPIAVADFDYRYLIPVIPFVSLAAGLAFAPARIRPTSAPPAPSDVDQPDSVTEQVHGPVALVT